MARLPDDIRFPDITGLPQPEISSGGAYRSNKYPHIEQFKHDWWPEMAGWLVSQVKCIACFKEWVAVHPEDLDGPFLECPRCGKMAGEKQPLEDGE